MAFGTSNLVFLVPEIFILVSILGLIIWGLITSMRNRNPSSEDPRGIEAGLTIPSVPVTRQIRQRVQVSAKNRRIIKRLLNPTKGMLQILRKQVVSSSVVPATSASEPTSLMSQQRDSREPFLSIAISNALLSDINTESFLDHVELLARRGWTLHVAAESDGDEEPRTGSTSGLEPGLVFGDTEIQTIAVFLPPAQKLINDDHIFKDQRSNTPSSIATPSLPVFASATNATALPIFVSTTSASFKSLPVESHSNSEMDAPTIPSLTLPILPVRCGSNLAIKDYVDKDENIPGVESKLFHWSHALISDDSWSSEYSLLDDASLRLLDHFPSPPPRPCSSRFLSVSSTHHDQAESNVEDRESLQWKMSYRKRVPLLLESNGLKDEDILESSFNYPGFCEQLAASQRQQREDSASATAVNSDINVMMSPRLPQASPPSTGGLDYLGLGTRKRASIPIYKQPEDEH